MLYIWGKKAEGDLSRPFKTGGGLMDSLSEFSTILGVEPPEANEDLSLQLVTLVESKPTPLPSRKPKSLLPRRTFKRAFLAAGESGTLLL